MPSDEIELVVNDTALTTSDSIRNYVVNDYGDWTSIVTASALDVTGSSIDFTDDVDLCGLVRLLAPRGVEREQQHGQAQRAALLRS